MSTAAIPFPHVQSHIPDIDTSVRYSRITTEVSVSDRRAGLLEHGELVAATAYRTSQVEVPDWPSGHVTVTLRFPGFDETESPEPGAVRFECDQVERIGVLARAFTALWEQLCDDGVPGLVRGQDAAASVGDAS